MLRDRFDAVLKFSFMDYYVENPLPPLQQRLMAHLADKSASQEIILL
jgi:hypothetical protein